MHSGRRSNMWIAVLLCVLSMALATHGRILSVREIPFSPADHTFYRRYNQIHAWLKEKQTQLPDLVTLKQIGSTHENRSLLTLEISRNKSKPGIWVDAGIHAREWISPAAVLFVIDKLLDRSFESEVMLSKYQFYFMPLMNPDGYEYSHERDRMWRKNRKPYAFSKCIGVDLNRNFPYAWGIVGSSNSPCSTIYRGPQPASELETKAVVEELTRLSNHLLHYVSIHSYGQFITIPFSFSRSMKPKYYDQMMKFGNTMVRNIRRKFRYYYVAGRSSDLLYLSSGCSDDFATGALQIPHSFTIELPDVGDRGFLLPPSHIVISGEQLWEMIKVLTM